MGHSPAYSMRLSLVSGTDRGGEWAFVHREGCLRRATITLFCEATGGRGYLRMTRIATHFSKYYRDRSWLEESTSSPGVSWTITFTSCFAMVTDG